MFKLLSKDCQGLKGQFQNIIYNQIKGIRVRPARGKPTFYELEIRQYKKNLHLNRLKIQTLYNERQTIIENKFIDDYNKSQQEKHERDLTRFRGSIIKIANATEKHIQFIQQREKENSQKKRKWSLEEDVKRLNRQRMIKMMNLDSKEWYVLDRIEEQMKDYMLIPDIVYSESDYYLKLQQQAFYYEQGDLQSFDKISDEQDIIKYKNTKLIPLYQKILSILKYIKETQEYKLIKEYDYTKALILQQENLTEPEKQAKITQMKKIYYGLLLKVREQLNQPKNQIDFLSRQLVLLYNLLLTWAEYISLTKMSNLMVDLMRKAELAENIAEQQEDEEEKIDENDQQAKLKKQMEAFKDAQTSASERFTTDTEEESDIDENKLNITKEDLSKKMQDFSTPRGYTSAEAAFQENLSSESQESPETHASTSKVDKIMRQIEQNDEQIENLFESEYEKIKENLNSFYGVKEGKKEEVMDANQFIQSKEFESKIPRILIESIADFSIPKLDAQTIKEIKDLQQQSEKELREQDKIYRLKSTLIVEIFKNKLDQIGQNLNLSRKERNRLADLRDLLNIIGEKEVDEPRMLFKIIETYHGSLFTSDENYSQFNQEHI